MGVGGQRRVPTALLPGKNRVPIVQVAEWAPRTVWTVAENPTPPGFDPRTVQPVASCYTDIAIPAHQLQKPAGNGEEFYTLVIK
jgi:hypothetical protein